MFTFPRWALRWLFRRIDSTMTSQSYSTIIIELPAARSAFYESSFKNHVHFKIGETIVSYIESTVVFANITGVFTMTVAIKL